MIYSLYKENIFQKSLNEEVVLTESVSDIKEFALNIIYKIEDFIDKVCSRIRDLFLYNFTYFRNNVDKIIKGQKILETAKDPEVIKKYKDIIEEDIEIVQYSKVCEFLSKIIIVNNIEEFIDMPDEIKKYNQNDYILKVNIVENIDVASAIIINYRKNLDSVKAAKRSTKRLLIRTKDICKNSDYYDEEKKKKIISAVTDLYRFIKSICTEIYNHISNEYKTLTKVAIKLIRIADIEYLPNKALEDAVKEGDDFVVKIAIGQIISAHLFDKNMMSIVRNAIKYSESNGVKLFEDEFREDLEIITDSSKWNDDYLAEAMVNLQYNFRHERLKHVEEVRNYLYKSKLH